MEQNISKQQLYERVFEYFEKIMPNPDTELHYKNQYQLTVAVLLSAQCTDVRVNKITPAFFERFPDFQTLAKASKEQVFELIKSCSYPNNKAKYLIQLAKTITEKYNGQLPEDFKTLQTLPGIGRKSANVLAAILFNQPRIAVDTHVHRVAQRIGLTENAKTPQQTETQLLQYIPEQLRLKAHHWLILHGRYTCTARNPKCSSCGLRDICKFYSSKASDQQDAKSP
jgi:endonuclease-3